MKTVSDEFYNAAVTLSGAEWRLRDWHFTCSDEDEGQVYHLRDLAMRSSEVIREEHLNNLKMR